MAMRLLKDAPWHLLLLALVLAGLGVWNLASASRVSGFAVWKSQACWIAIGVATCLAMTLFDYRYLIKLSYPIYCVIILSLVAVLITGHTAKGASRWLNLGPIHLQPSELMKLGIVLVLARYYHEDTPPKGGYDLWRLIPPGLLLLIPLALVMMQPDLGTSIMIAAPAATIILFCKVRLKALAILALSLFFIAVLVWSFALKDYQKNRVFTFLNPGLDPLGTGYHSSQSLIAVGSGQWWGKGWRQGTQTQLSFLPEHHTDFVFSVWGEEHGLAGAVVLISLYLLLFFSSLGVAFGAREKFGILISLGITGMLFFQTFTNIGMVSGVLPVVGVTLPLMSYGGSSVLTTFVGFGLLMNIGMRRHLF
jgi:rod shape determining protein RodA